MTKDFIQVIVPLRLEWEPYYAMEGAFVGQRVQVTFAHREYVGVVSAVNVAPETAPERIQPARPTGLPPVTPQEIAFWRALAGYYLCSIGEVYKAAYPELKQESEAIQVRTDERLQKRLALLKDKLQKARKDQTRERYADEIGRLEAFLNGETATLEPGAVALSPAQETAADAIKTAFQHGKTVLLQGSAGVGKTQVCLQLARETLLQGKSVLFLAPEIAFSRLLEDRIARYFPQLLVFHSGKSAAQRRAVANTLREGKAQVVLGTRSALFLPHRNLGLIVVAQEHDTSYKQDSPAPRYQAREGAILLAGIHGAHVVLSSETPSLESLYNAESGLFAKVHLKEDSGKVPGLMLVNMAAEARKKGLVGSFSLKLLDQMHRVLNDGEKVLLVARSKAALPDCTAELEAIFGANPKGIVLVTPATAKDQPFGAFGLTAVLQSDGLLAKEDFRCDERAHQLLCLLRNKCRPDGLFVVQTREVAHPVFGEYNQERIQQLLAERRQFGYPPYTRMINVTVKDQNEKRGEYLARELAGAIRREIPCQAGDDGVRLFLSRDRALQGRKKALYAAILAFEKERKYSGHIIIDVDPV